MAVNRYASIDTIKWILQREFRSGSRNSITQEEADEYQKLLKDKLERLQNRIKVSHSCYVDVPEQSTSIYTTSSESLNLTFRTLQRKPEKKKKILTKYIKMVGNWWEKLDLPWTCPHCNITITKEMITSEVLIHRLRR